jgi:hypothetical protein
MNETQKSNTPMILGIIGFVAAIPGLLCSAMCGSMAEAGGAQGAGTMWTLFNLVPTVVALIFSFRVKSNSKQSGFVILGCTVLILLATIMTFNWVFGLITVACFTIAGVLAVKE